MNQNCPVKVLVNHLVAGSFQAPVIDGRIFIKNQTAELVEKAISVYSSDEGQQYVWDEMPDAVELEEAVGKIEVALKIYSNEGDSDIDEDEEPEHQLWITVIFNPGEKEEPIDHIYTLHYEFNPTQDQLKGTDGLKPELKHLVFTDAWKLKDYIQNHCDFQDSFARRIAGEMFSDLASEGKYYYFDDTETFSITRNAIPESIPAITDILSWRDVASFYAMLIYRHNLNMHPDTDFKEYVNDKGETIYTSEQAEKLNAVNTYCFGICSKEDIEIYEIGLQIQQAYMGVPIDAHLTREVEPGIYIMHSDNSGGNDPRDFTDQQFVKLHTRYFSDAAEMALEVNENDFNLFDCYMRVIETDDLYNSLTDAQAHQFYDHEETMILICDNLFGDPQTLDNFDKAIGYEQRGMGGRWEVIQDWTREFQRANKGRKWDDEFIDAVDEFVNAKLNQLLEGK